LHLLLDHEWPGNVRELANVIEGATLLTLDGVLRPHHLLSVLPARAADASQPPPRGAEVPDLIARDKALPPMREAREAFDRAYLEEALRRAGGNVSAAAKLAGRNRTDFHDLLRRHDISATEFRER
jgi:two-component system response regulator GlrR